METEGSGQKVSLYLGNSLCAARDWLSSLLRHLVQDARSGILRICRIFFNLSAETLNPPKLRSATARHAALKFSIARDTMMRVHSQLPVRFSDATGYFHSSSKKER